MTEAEIAWVAGLFEGEGSFQSMQPKGCGIPRLTIHMSDKDVLERLAMLTGSDLRAVRRRKATHANRKPIWSWTLGTQKAVALMKQLYPHLGKRRRARWDELYAKYLNTHRPRECPWCEHIFTPGRSDQRWCSQKCRSASYNARRRPAPEPRTCPECNQVFTPQHHRDKTWCSEQCLNARSNRRRKSRGSSPSR